MVNTIEKPKKNLGESIRQRLKSLSEQRNRPFDEILRYYAMERFLYRLSIYSDISYIDQVPIYLRRNNSGEIGIIPSSRGRNNVCTKGDWGSTA